MLDFESILWGLGAFIAGSILYSAWHAWRTQNPRDARLLAGIGAGSAMTLAAAWMA